MDLQYCPATGLYRSGGLGVSKHLTEELLATSYLRLKKEQTLETVFYERVPTLREYLDTSANSICLGAFRKVGTKQVDFAGLSWISHRQEMGNRMFKAEVGFAFFRHCASPTEKVELGKMMTQVLFDLFNIDVLIGTTPVDNKLALGYSTQVGFGVHGPIPNYISWEGALSDVMVSVLTKTEWQAKHKPQILLEQEAA